MEPRICPHCGHESTDAEPVVWRNVYVGGHGYMPKLQCEDRIQCWSRWDKAHDWPPMRQEVSGGNG